MLNPPRSTQKFYINSAPSTSSANHQTPTINNPFDILSEDEEEFQEATGHLSKLPAIVNPWAKKSQTPHERPPAKRKATMFSDIVKNAIKPPGCIQKY